MDEFEKVRWTKPEIDGAEENLAAARALLLTEIQEERRPARPRAARRPWFIAAGALGAAAAVTTGVLVVSAITAPSPTPTVEAVPTRTPGPALEPTATPGPTISPAPEPPTAKTVLVGAATVVGDDPGPVAGPGQYLRIHQEIRNLELYSPQDQGNANRTQATAAWVSTSSQTWYIPADRTGEWVQVLNADLQVVELFGGEAGRLSQEWLDRFSWRVDPQVLRYQGGGHVGTPVPNQTYVQYAEMPRDPAALLAWTTAYLRADEAASAGIGAVTFLIDELQQGSAPADLKAAMYRALSLIPGVSIVDSEGDVVTLLFSGLPQVDRSYSMSIDTRTAQVVRSTINDGPRGGIVPDSVPDHELTTTVQVVDEAP
ncbi:hypothetical protein LVJ59_00470 [Microbacterium sp. KKR3/1]|uniref:hypothetical protein n=1 Tax=Microbacterium sp. KKR3/1 TaxID=2904241 RepID=UPI001E5ACFBF|nr:hypothetical protein [Microbacterium sp. KKR3/1]MCE0507502.1 hypothetical protein [Microbacterium sp. KKR3/1]